MVHEVEINQYCDGLLLTIPYSTMVFKDLLKSFHDDFPERVWRKECKKWYFPTSDYAKLQDLMDSKNKAVTVFDQKEKKISTQDFVEIKIYRSTNTIASRTSFEMVRQYGLIDEFKKRHGTFESKCWDSIKKVWYS